jgi:hypothetical protein
MNDTPNAKPSAPALPDEAVPVPPKLLVAAQRINQELRRRPEEPLTLSFQAREQLELLHGEYLADLGALAARIARQENLSTVDRSHVNEANTRLISGAENTKLSEAITNTLGGLTGGGALASAYSLLFVPGSHSAAEGYVAAILGIISAVFLTTYFMRLKFGK